MRSPAEGHGLYGLALQLPRLDRRVGLHLRHLVPQEGGHLGTVRKGCARDMLGHGGSLRPNRPSRLGRRWSGAGLQVEAQKGLDSITRWGGGGGRERHQAGYCT